MGSVSKIVSDVISAGGKHLATATKASNPDNIFTGASGLVDDPFGLVREKEEEARAAREKEKKADDAEDAQDLLDEARIAGIGAGASSEGRGVLIGGTDKNATTKKSLFKKAKGA